MAKKGFSLIEVLIAMAVLSIALLAVVQMNIMYVKANTYNLQLSQATFFAQEKMEELVSYARSDRTDNFSAFDFDYMTSDDVNFTSVAVGSTTTVIPGLLSAANQAGAADINTADGSHYYSMWDSGGGVYMGIDRPKAPGGATVTAFDINRTWTVEDFQHLDGRQDDFVHVTVTTEWISQTGTKSVTLESLIHRRQ